ncbi:MAG: alpha/beta hydrolase [Spirosomataceae bacterium]
MRLLVVLGLLFLSGITTTAQIPSSNRVALSETRLYCELVGKGEVVVFIHGLALDSRMWDLQWERFSKKFKVLRYDVRGFGLSDRARDPHNPTEDLKELLDSLKIEKVHLVGLSMGANIALNFAAKYPNRVNKVVAVDAHLDGFNDYTSNYQTLFGQIIYLASHQGWHDEEQRKWLLSPLMRLYAADDKTIINLSEIIADYNGDHFINPRINPDFGTPTTAELLTNIKAPTLVIVGEKR